MKIKAEYNGNSLWVNNIINTEINELCKGIEDTTSVIGQSIYLNNTHSHKLVTEAIDEIKKRIKNEKTR